MNGQSFIDMQIAVAALYIIYPLFISGRVAHKYARLYLLTIFPLSAIIATVKIPFWTSTAATIDTPHSAQVANFANLAPQTIEQATSYIPYIYWGGVAIMGLWFMMAAIKVLRLMASTKPENGVRYIERDGAFSFFGTLFLSTKYKNSDATTIIAHEKCHASHLHSIDVIYCNLCRAMLWFNPFSWLIFHSLRQVHEWQADAYVINLGVNKIQYIDLLLEAGSTTNVQVVNSINYSLTKKRIIMIAKSQKNNALRLVIALPVVATLVLSLSLTTKASEVVATIDAISVDPVTEMATQTPAETPVVTAHQLPQFTKESKGGIVDFQSWIASNIKYPAAASKDGVQGRVHLSFVVEHDGTVTDVKVLRGISVALDQAAIDAIASSPKWYKSGYNKGKPVRFTFNIPIDFVLPQAAK